MAQKPYNDYMHFVFAVAIMFLGSWNIALGRAIKAQQQLLEAHQRLLLKLDRPATSTSFAPIEFHDGRDPH